MAQITVISVGTLKENYLKDAIEEYKKRLSLYAKIDEISIKEEAIKNEDDPSEIKRALEIEGEKILAAIPKGSYKIALCVEGRQFDSPALAGLISNAVDTTGKISLIIGSSHGLSETVKSECDTRLSFSKMTFPHQLMRVLLMEALYRSFTIIKGKKYHNKKASAIVADAFYFSESSLRRLFRVPCGWLKMHFYHICLLYRADLNTDAR